MVCRDNLALSEGLLLIAQEKGKKVRFHGLISTGYEPNALAMAERASSMPPAIEGNPFWSERARGELQVQMARPQELPQPSESPEGVQGVGRESTTGVLQGQNRDERDRSRERRRNTVGKGRGQKMEFSTPPSSWTVRNLSVGHEGRGGTVLEEQENTSLQRELEKEVCAFLHGENQRLRMEIDNLKAQKELQKQMEETRRKELELETQRLQDQLEQEKKEKSSSWSQVSPVPPPTTPRQKSFWETPQEVRFTPQGTRVPDGPPPESVIPEVPVPPSWMMDGQEDCEGDRAKHLHDGVQRGDRASAKWHGGQEGDRAKHLHDQDQRGDRAQHGGSYHGHQGWHHQHRGKEHGDPRGGKGWQEPLPEEERKAFEEEIKRLTRELEKKGQFQSDYWKTPTGKNDTMEVDQSQKKEETTQVVSAMNEGNLGSGRELPELNGDITPITLGDWLVSIGPMMKDLTPLSAGWWQKTYQKAEEYYGMWRNSTPLQRVQIQPELPEELQQPQYMRTEQRGVGLLLKAVPKEMRDVLIASRELYSTTIIYRLLVTFQPGGANEKALLLKHLTSISAGKDLNEMSSALRTWRRFFKRAVEINTTLPDPTLLLKALDNPSAAISKVDAQAAFRLAQTRSQLGVDEAPSQETIWRFSQCVLAEIETLQLLNGTSASGPATEMVGNQQEVGQVAAKVKALELKSKGQGKDSFGKTAKPCQFFGSTEGCRLGAQCRYLHDWNGVAEKQGRCWTCSSTTHLKHECPSRQEGQAKQEGHSRFSSGGSGDGRDGKGKGKTKKGGGKKNDGKDSEKPEKPKEEEQPAVKEVSDPKPTAASSGTTAASTGGTSGGGAQDGLVQEVTSLLRSLRLSDGDQRMIKVCQVRKLAADDQVATLIDGGATHCLRMRKSQEEWDSGIPVTVQLASGEVEMRQCGQTNTLLVQEKIQPIVPVAKLLELGYTINWSRQECRIENVKYGRVPVILNQGCPTVSAEWGEKLMSEVEEAEKKKMRIKAVLHCGIIAEDDYEKKVAALTSWFPNTPYRILADVPGERQWDPEQVPVNRRKRRQIDQAKHLIIDMFSGNHERRWKSLESADTVVIEVDLLKGINVMDPHVSGWIESLIETGKVTTWLSAPPCRTVSACRQRGDCDGGPAPLRGRNGLDRYGLPGLNPRQKEQTDHDTTLWIKNLRWMMMVKEKRPEADILVEQPADPSDWKQDGEEYPTFLNWEETTTMEKTTGAFRVTFDQGAVGHQAPKPTTLITTLEKMKQLQGLKCQQNGMKWASTVSERIEQSKGLAAWAPGLVDAIAQSVLASGTERQVKALSKGERDEASMWESHFAAGHIPFRRDCMLCVESMGRDRYRKRQSHPALHTMSVDVAGPFDPGQDQEINQPRYLMMATITVPVMKDPVLPEGLNRLEASEKKEEDVQLEQEELLEDGDEEEQFQERLEEDQEELKEVEVKVMEEANEKWKQFLTQVKQDEAEVKSITWGVPMQSRSTNHVLEAVSKIYSRFRSLQIPILRLHCDRAREFTCARFRAWVAGRDMHLTFSAGDEPTANSKIEREIGVIKGRTRVLLRSSKAPVTWWPLASRHALDERFRSQLWELGLKSPEVLPFGCVAMAKRKTWENRSQPWKWPFQKVRCWGPASDMSLTSRGHFIQTEDGRFMRSTVIVVPKQMASSQEELEHQREDRHQEDEIANPVNPAPGNAEEATWDGGRLDEGNQGEREKEEQHQEESSEQWKFPRVPEGEVVIDETASRETFVVKQPDVIKYRLLGKTPPPQGRQQEQQGLSLRSMQLRERGEWTEEWTEEDEIDWRSRQHNSLRSFVQEEVERIQRGDQVLAKELEVIRDATQEVKELERQLKEEDKERTIRSVKSLTKIVEEEVLQTRIVPLEEVRRNPEEWREAFLKEYNTLTSGPVTPITKGEVEEMKNEGQEIEMLPMKAIASKKPPAKHKGRVVVCGNFSQQKEEENVSVGGACAIAIRSVIHTAAVRGWSLGSIDVSGAFLQAPRRPRTAVTIADPPALLKELNLCAKDEVWKVQCALYGLTESPADWSAFRDVGLSEIKWHNGEEEFHLKETPEKHVWKICNGEGMMKGVVAVYVDDFLVSMEEKDIGAAFEAIKKKWVCSKEEMVEHTKPMRFCGFEIQKRRGGGFWVGQTGYLRDLLKKREVQGFEKHPCPVIKEGPDEENVQLQDVRRAQMLVGEAMWLSGRSRPDICYTTGVMSRLLHRRPRYACEIGEHLLKYLNRTQNRKLEYVRSEDQRKQVEGCEQVQRGDGSLQTMADVSFSPSHEQHRSIQGICIEHKSNLIFWESVRQPFVALSTCESELIGYVEGHQAAEGIYELLRILEHPIEEKHILGDNKAAISICVNETGAWRTRHLRIRSYCLREVIQKDTSWKILHLRGTSISADGMTKPLQQQAHQRFIELIGMGDEQEEQGASVKKLEINHREIRTAVNKATTMAIVGGMLVSSEWKWLGAILVLCACLLKWREEKEPSANQDMQDRKKTPKKKWERGYNEKGSDRSGTVTPVDFAGACTLQETSEKREDQGCRNQPGIRAFRLSPEPKSSSGATGASSSHGEEDEVRRSATASTAKQRGRAALSKGTEGQAKVSVEVEELSEDLEISLRIRAKDEDLHKEVGSKKAAGYGKSASSGVEREEETGQRVPSDLQRGLAEAKKQARETPWNLRRFQKEPTGGNDQWDESLLREEGWLVRCHKKHRVRPFHPLHGSTPEEGRDLQPDRTTVIFQGGQRVGIVHDQWQDPRASRLQDYTSQWKGFTFFRVKKKREARGEESDGSYEKVPGSEESW